MKRKSICTVCILAILAAFTAGLSAIAFAADNGGRAGEKPFSSSAADITYNIAAPEFMRKVVLADKTTVDGATVKGAQIRAYGDTQTVTVQYNKKINVRKNTKDTPLLEFLITADRPEDFAAVDREDYEFCNLIVTLTDAYNARNYVQIKMNLHHDTRTQSCAMAGSATQKYRGLLWDQSSYGDYYGTDMAVNYYGFPNSINPDGGENRYTYNVGSFSLDYEEGSVYCAPALQHDKVVNLRDASILSPGETPWQGFTNGDCYLSVTMGYVQSSGATLMLLGINGNAIVGESVRDETPPVVFYEGEHNLDNLPYAKVGAPYPVLSVSAFDGSDGELSAEKITVTAYRNYNSQGEKIYTVTDGTFTPDEEGTYTIVYSATDAAGNTGKLETTVLAKSSLSDMSLEGFDESVWQSLTTGQLLALPAFTVVGGAGGYASPEITLTDGKGRNIAANEGTFPIDTSGKYTLTVIARDYIGTEKTFVYNFNVSKRETPLLQTVPVPQYVRTGKKATFAAANAFDYASFDTPVEVDVKTYVQYGEDEPVLLADNSFTPTTDGNFAVVYVAKNIIDGKETALKYQVEAVSPAAVGEYFCAAFEMQITAAGDRTTYAFTGGNTLTFANALAANGLNAQFGFAAGKANVDSLAVRMQDVRHLHEKVTAVFSKKSATTCTVTVGGVQTEFPSAMFDVAEVVNLTVRDGWLLKDGVRLAEITRFDSGKKFERFDGRYVYLSFGFKGTDANGQTEFFVRRINNQIIGRATQDTIGPEVCFGGETVRSAMQGETVFVPFAYASDVLDPEATLSVSVSAPDGTAVPFVNREGGTHLELTQAGEYTFVYTATDGNGKTAQARTYITATAVEKPPVTVGAVAYRVQKGATVSYSVTYDAEKYTGKLFIKNDAGVTEDVTETAQYTFTEKGTYYLYIYVCDERSYAYTLKSYKLVVTE